MVVYLIIAVSVLCMYCNSSGSASKQARVLDPQRRRASCELEAGGSHKLAEEAKVCRNQYKNCNTDNREKREEPLSWPVRYVGISSKIATHSPPTFF